MTQELEKTRVHWQQVQTQVRLPLVRLGLVDLA
jgi:hypothetical protein